jgi:hypothetical protein
MDAGHLVTSVDRTRRRRGGIDTARHGGKYAKSHSTF